MTDRNDPASLYRSQASRDWWVAQARFHELFVSAEVLTELSHPGYPARQAALRWIEKVPALAIDEEVQGFARILVHHKAMPGPLTGDAIHVAAACRHGMEYILTWNVRHLANPNKLRHLRTLCLRFGFVPPQIVTPDLLWEEEDDERRS